MRIWSQHRPGVFWFQPATYGPADSRGRRQMSEGLKLEFTTLGGPGAGSVLDTEAHGWSDELREEIEAWLVGLPEWGFTLQVADTSVSTQRVAAGGCEVMTRTAEGVRKCARPIVEGGDLCEIHASQFARAAKGLPDLPSPPAALERAGAEPDVASDEAMEVAMTEAVG